MYRKGEYGTVMGKARHLWRLASNFSLSFALSQLLIVVFEKMGKAPLRIYRWRNAYLHRVIDKLVQDNSLLSKIQASGKHDDTIYTMWYQGVSTAPTLVQTCLDTMRQAAHDVVVIDESNIDEYMDVPSCIAEKLGGEVTFTHFSDYVRFALLSKHGGAWMDSTILCLGPMPDEVFDLPFFTYVTKGTIPNPRCANSWWKGFAVGTDGTTPMFDLARLILEAYWERYDVLADYFLVDHVLSYCLGLAPYSQYCEMIPEQDSNIYWLLHHYADEWTDRDSCQLAFINKLSYKDMNVPKASEHSVWRHVLSAISKE